MGKRSSKGRNEELVNCISTRERQWRRNNRRKGRKVEIGS